MSDVRERLEALSLEIEEQTGFDSIKTTRDLHRGECPYPDCKFRSADAATMWKHMHFSRKHGLSFGRSWAWFVKEHSL